MKTALVIGATGLVGRYLVDELLEHGSFDKVVLWVRKPLDLKHPILHQKVVDFDSIEHIDIPVYAVYCCLGTTIGNAGSKSAFRKVDIDYPLKIAALALEQGADSYAIVTSMGADPSSRFFYNRVKGEVEERLSEMGYRRLLIFRPSMLLGERKESRFGERVGKLFMRLFSFFIPLDYKAIHGRKVARAMCVKMQESKEGKFTYSSGIIQGF